MNPHCQPEVACEYIRGTQHDSGFKRNSDSPEHGRTRVRDMHQTEKDCAQKYRDPCTQRAFQEANDDSPKDSFLNKGHQQMDAQSLQYHDHCDRNWRDRGNMIPSDLREVANDHTLQDSSHHETDEKIASEMTCGQPKIGKRAAPNPTMCEQEGCCNSQTKHALSYGRRD